MKKKVSKKVKAVIDAACLAARCAPPRIVIPLWKWIEFREREFTLRAVDAWENEGGR